MSDEQTPRSGSRWEPAPDDETVAQPTPPPAPPVDADPVHPAHPVEPRAEGWAAPAGRRTWTQRVRGNGGLVGAAVALVLVGGLGGFAVGHATAGPDRFGLVGEQFPGGPHGDGHHGFPGHDDEGFGVPPGASGDDSPAPDDDSTASDDDGTDGQSGSTL